MLFIVPTPIGNIRDITYRAVDVLTEVQVILSEDTRVTRKLLSMLEISPASKRFISYFDHNESQRIPEIMSLLQQGTDVALVSDAGTPVINDPGYKLIRAVREIIAADPSSPIRLEVLPGATSITTALVTSALPPDRFTYLGYFPRKPGDRRKLFRAAKNSAGLIKSTFVAFETKHRLLASLIMMQEVLGSNVQVALCRELTKMYESVETGDVAHIIEIVRTNKIDLRGEIVVVFNV